MRKAKVKTNTTTTPPAPPVQGEPDPELKAKLEAEAAQAKAQAEVNALADTLRLARDTAQSALQQLIEAQVPETDLNRLALENAFEVVRGGKPAGLPAALKQIGVAITILSNTTRANQEQLAVLKSHAQRLRKLVPE